MVLQVQRTRWNPLKGLLHKEGSSYLRNLQPTNVDRHSRTYRGLGSERERYSTDHQRAERILLQGVRR